MAGSDELRKLSKAFISPMASFQTVSSSVNPCHIGGHDVQMPASPRLVHTIRAILWQMFLYHCLKYASHSHSLEVEGEVFVFIKSSILVYCERDEF